MRKQTFAILLIIGIGSLFSYVYAASTIISDSGISTTNLTVTGTCTGCGGEADYTNYSVLLNQTVSGSGTNDIRQLHISDDGSLIARDSTGSVSIVDINGNQLTSRATTGTATGIFHYDLSESGKYKIIYQNGNKTLSVFKDNSLLHYYTIDSTQIDLSTGSVAISPSGKYIELYGFDVIGASSERLIILRGS